MTAIELRDVYKRFGAVAVLDDINVSVDAGEFVVVVGPSGCGKSTLLRLLAGLEAVSSGDIVIGGRVVNRLTPPERGIAMVFQSYALYPHMTVYKNLAFGLRMGRTGRAEIDAKVRAAAASLQLDTLLDRRPAQLSGGQRQRVAIGRAIVREPRVFLFDEPLSNLDAALRVQTRTEIARLHRRLGTTMVYVTHDQTEAMTLADKIVVLNRGRVAQTGAPLELYQRPADRFVAGFIGSPQMNFIDARVGAADAAGARLALAGGGTLTVPGLRGCRADDAVSVGVRPQHLREQGAPRRSDAAALVLDGRVDNVERLGDVSYVYLRRADGGELTVATPGVSAAREDDALTASAALADVHVFDVNGVALR